MSRDLDVVLTHAPPQTLLNLHARHKKMSPVQFTRLFIGEVRVDFNWNLFLNSNWEILVRTVEIPNQASSIILPWYLTKGGRPCAFDEPDAAPLSLAEAAENQHILNERSIEPCLGFQGHLLPGYRLSSERVLLLDGSHRALGMMMSLDTARFKIAEIHGPINAQICPDLRSWTGQ